MLRETLCSAVQRGKGRQTVENSIAVVGVKKALLLGKYRHSK
jgi:hypothetical protein